MSTGRSSTDDDRDAAGEPAVNARPIALVGIGKIARDQHIPALANDPDWDLAATVSRHATVDGVESFAEIGEMLAARPDIGTVSIAVPPGPRFPIAAAALAAGRNVMLEKPPGATLAECHTLAGMAAQAGVSLFASWHSREAHAVAAARSALLERKITRLAITWKEDVRRWHPGQDWVFEPGGMGVLDPGINALSILTEILPDPVHLTSAELDVPANRQTPIAARLVFAAAGGAEMTAEFDWRQEGPQTWDIDIETTQGPLRLTDGGAKLYLDGALATEGPNREYAGLYRRMAALVESGSSDVDLSPMIHVSDAFTLGHRNIAAPFEF